MIFFLVSAAVLTVLALYNLTIAILGLFPAMRTRAVGSLSKTTAHRNVRGRYHVIPLILRYTYTYSHKGKTYHYTAESFHSKKRLHQRVSMIFVKGFPRHAYPNKFKPTKEWLYSFLLLILAALLVVEGLSV